MIKLEGRSIAEGICIGRIQMLTNGDNPACNSVDDIQTQIERYLDARRKTTKLYEKLKRSSDESQAALFDTYILLLGDEYLNETIINIITNQKVNAEYAVSLMANIYEDRLAMLKDDYLSERSLDIRDIAGRLIEHLKGIDEGETLAELTDPVIVMADYLTPSETVRMDKSKLMGFVTRQGSSYSHTAILARNMGIPALSAIVPDAQYDGMMAILDASNNTLIVDPDNETVELYRNRQIAVSDREMSIYSPDEKLFINIDAASDLDSIDVEHIDGIGLFRTEYLYMERDEYPSEEAQFEVYSRVAREMGDKRVIIRTLDLGADKQLDYMGIDNEQNPAMGFRAIRICLKRPELFRTQLRAIYRASVYGNVAIMYPMIISVDEIRQIKDISASVREELRVEGIETNNILQGIMIETPAAAMISDDLAKEVDFFSIGTNDLTQYTLAIDRQNEKLEDIYDPAHPAVIKMIDMICKNAHNAGIWVGLCGELAANPKLHSILREMGVDELSVPYSMAGGIRRE